MQNSRGSYFPPDVLRVHAKGNQQIDFPQIVLPVFPISNFSHGVAAVFLEREILESSRNAFWLKILFPFLPISTDATATARARSQPQRARQLRHDSAASCGLFGAIKSLQNPFGERSQSHCNWRLRKYASVSWIEALISKTYQKGMRLVDSLFTKV